MALNHLCANTTRLLFILVVCLNDAEAVLDWSKVTLNRVLLSVAAMGACKTNALWQRNVSSCRTNAAFSMFYSPIQTLELWSYMTYLGLV